MKSSNIRFGEFITLIALLMAMVSLAINMVLPAFEDIGHEFDLANGSRVHLTVSLLYLGLGFSQLAYGPLSDSWGRKKMMVTGLLIFLTGCLVSFSATSLYILVLGQFIQGIGLGAPRALSLAIVRDKFSGSLMAKAMSFIMVIYIFVPIISPVLGKAVVSYYSWRMVYPFFLSGGLLVLFLFIYRMPETLNKTRRTPFEFKNIYCHLIFILNNRQSLGYIIILGVYSGIFISYLNLSQAIFETQYGLGNRYPLIFAILSIGIGVASFINGRVVYRVSSTTITRYTITSSFLLSVVHLITFYCIPNTLGIFMLFMFFHLICYGFLVGNLSALAIEPLGHIAGLGASVIGAVSTIISVPISILIGSVFHKTALPLILGFLCASMLSIAVFNIINKSIRKWEIV